MRNANIIFGIFLVGMAVMIYIAIKRIREMNKLQKETLQMLQK